MSAVCFHHHRVFSHCEQFAQEQALSCAPGKRNSNITTSPFLLGLEILRFVDAPQAVFDLLDLESTESNS